MKTKTNQITLKELDQSNLDWVVNYWTFSSDEHLISMGVDLDKIPTRKDLKQMIGSQIGLKDEQKQSLAFIAYLDNEAVGHCNVNQIHFGKEAHIHLHIWNEKYRREGFGSEMVKKSIPQFVKRLNLSRIWCEPYAKNTAPNKTLLKIGFKYVKSYKTVPGSINFEQDVHKYVFERSDLKLLQE